ncbi:MAG: glycine/betaine/sarcosine/D-proline family reductase selenoprotein B [Acidimicrobiia bacterium]|nr:glycine/betaine/sarcosine/D-proline family reductase selenoprotein B [Acidimicrobiia bacterium]
MPSATARELRSGSSDLPPADYIVETRKLYASLGYDDYRWAESTDPPAWKPINKPLRSATVGIIGSGGVYRRGQIAFHTKDDTSIRLIDVDTPAAELRVAHFAYDQADARSDPNCVFPLQRLRELVEQGVVGGISPLHFGFMGGIYSTRRLLAETAPLLIDQVRRLHEAGDLDVLLLVPV